MLAQFSIWPLDDPHLADDMEEIAEVLDGLQVHYEIGPLATTIEGDWKAVLGAVQACHTAVRASHRRVLTTVTIDDDATRPQSLSKSCAAARGVTGG